MFDWKQEANFRGNRRGISCIRFVAKYDETSGHSCSGAPVQAHRITQYTQTIILIAYCLRITRQEYRNM